MKNTIVSLALLLTATFAPVRADDAFAPLFPFVISYDAQDNASSMAHLLDAPAGKHGFVRVENGRFVNDAGPVRLHATNLTGPANFPTHEQADKLAARLARFGINCVRLHYFDAEYGNLGMHLIPFTATGSILAACPSILERRWNCATGFRPNRPAGIIWCGCAGLRAWAVPTVKPRRYGP
jgi:hypothetical protein